MKLMIASDIHGSAPCCTKMLEAFSREEKKLLCVRGNCDTEVDQMVLEFPILADYCFLELADGEGKSGPVIFATHGHIYNPHHLPPLSDGDILLNGHTHIPACEEILDMEGNRYQYLNPGSVSIPKEESQRSYMVYEKGCFIWKNLEGEEYLTWKTESRC